MLIISAIFMFSGCAVKSVSEGNEISEDQANKITVGKTTKDDVTIMFGEPTKIAPDAKTYYYSWKKGQSGSVVGIALGSTTSRSLVVIFDDNNVVRKYGLTAD